MPTSQENTCSECNGERVIHVQQNGDDVEFPCKTRSVEQSAPIRAVVPVHIARKWNAIALQQLAAAIPQLDEQLERSRDECHFADDCARMWQDIAEVRAQGDDVGLTVDGQIVAVTKDECEPGCWCCQQESRP